MKIKELSDATGLSVDTIRYYEKIKLLPKPSKNSSGYRVYGEDMVKTIELIAHTKELGFTLKEIRDLAELLTSRKLSQKQMGKKLSEKLDVINKKIHELKQVKKNIEKVLVGNCEYRSELSKRSKKTK